MTQERNTKELENTLERFDGYTDGLRLMMLTHRNKEGGKSNRPDRFARKRVSTTKEEFAENLSELLELKSLADVPMRIYSSVNPRSIEKGIRELKRRMLEADYYDVKSKHGFYLDIKNQWFSALAKPAAKAGSLFVVDIDSQEEYVSFQEDVSKLDLSIVSRFTTKNGWHVIMEPFNPSLLPGYDIKTDALLLLSWS